MASTGLAIRQRVLRNTRGALGFNGRTTAAAGGTDRIRDAIRFDMNTLSTEDVSGAYLRITQAHSGTATASAATTLTDSTTPFVNAGLPGALVTAFTAAGATTVLTITSNSTTVLTGTGGWSNGTPASTSTYTVTYGHVARVTRPDIATGDLYFDPVVTTLVVTNAYYELYYHGIRPDEIDEARDLALTTRTSPWRLKPLSVIREIADWATAAYSGALGGVTLAAAVPTALAFPTELFQQSMVVTNSAADGYIASESYYVQPSQTYTLFGRVAARAQTASIRVRRITSTAADITISGTSTFTLRGWQWFWVTFTVPSDCEEIQLWLGGASATCVSEWAGVGLIPSHETLFSLEGRVLSEHDIGTFYAYSLPTSATGQLNRSPLHATKREAGGDGVIVFFDSPPAQPVYYQERHRYAALQSDYLSLVDRATGDATSTDCNIDYIAWATIVELLEPKKRNDELDRLLLDAYKNLKAWDRRVGASPMIAPEFKTQGGIRVLQL